MIVILFLLVPLTILSASSIESNQLAVVCGCIVLFSAVIAAILKVSSYEMIATSAVYAAVLLYLYQTGRKHGPT